MISINNQENKDIKLIYKYLVKYLIKEKNKSKEDASKFARNLIKKYNNKDKLHELCHWLQSKSLTFFNLYFLRNLYTGEGKAPLSKTHFEIWDELESMILKKDYNNRNYICPRGFGKTSTISTSLVIWCHVNGYKKYTVIASAVSDTAEQFLQTIKNAIIDNPYIEKSFGKLIDKKNFICNSEKIEFTNISMVESISASGAIRGKNYNNTRIELLILDDYQKSDETKTHDQREKKWKIFNEDAKNAMQKDNSSMLAVGTLQHSECFYSRLNNSPTWKSRIEKAVLIDDVDDYFHSGLWEEFYKLLINKNDDNRLDTAKEFYFQNSKDMQFPLLWSEYWNCLDYALSYYENRQAFFQECQNSVNEIGERWFKHIFTESPVEIESHDFRKTMLVCDPASTVTKRSDHTAMCVGSLAAENKLKYIRKGILVKLEFNDYIDKVIELLKEFPSITHIFIEKNTYQGADVIKIKEKIKEDKSLNDRNITIINERTNKNKDDRISTIVQSINLGNIIFNEEDTEFIDQISEFCGQEYSVLGDDGCDVVAYFNDYIDKIFVSTRDNYSGKYARTY